MYATKEWGDWKWWQVYKLLPFNFESVKRVSHNMQTEYFFNSPNIVLKRLVLYLAVQDTSC